MKPNPTTYDITPMPYVNRTHQGKYSPKSMRYHAWLEHARRMRITFPPRGANITFIIPMPPEPAPGKRATEKKATWSRNRRLSMCMEQHEETPDLANLLKALEDAVYHRNNKDPAYRDDKIISSYGKLEKLWGTRGAIVIS